MKKICQLFSATSLILTSLCSLPTQATYLTAQEHLADNDYKQVLQAYLESAKLGHAPSQFGLAVMYFQGQAGEKDLVKSFSWMALANEYQYPNSERFAQEIYSTLTKEQQDQAIKYATSLVKKYGRQITEANLLPKIEQSPIEAQKITSPAEMAKSGKLVYSGTSDTRARNEALIRAAIRNGNPDIFYKQIQNLDAGLVEVEFDVDEYGRTKDWDILFSWPNEKFVEGTLNAVQTSRYTPAKKQQETTAQYGLVYTANFGQEGIVDFRQGYPHIYKSFRSVRNLAQKNNPNAKYTYAKLLRAYKRILDKENYEDFQPILKEAAELEQVDAQYDYAMLNIYMKQQPEEGLEWLITAAKAGHAKAQGRLGELLFESPTPYIQQDIGKAKFWLNLAAKQNNFRAQQKLVEIEIINQQNTDKKFAAQAIDWLEEIEDDGNPTPYTYFLLAKVSDILGERGDAKDWIKDAIYKADALGWRISDWKRFQKGLTN